MARNHIDFNCIYGWDRRLVCDCHAAGLRALHEIYVNGTVLTMDASDRIVEAVSVRNGRIDAVGGSEALLAAADDQTSVVDSARPNVDAGIC